MAVAPSINMPALPLPEIKLRSATVCSANDIVRTTLDICTPVKVLGNAAVPAALVPMMLPSTRLLVAPAGLINTPKALLPEMIFDHPQQSRRSCYPLHCQYYATSTVAQVCGTVGIGADVVASTELPVAVLPKMKIPEP